MSGKCETREIRSKCFQIQFWLRFALGARRWWFSGKFIKLNFRKAFQYFSLIYKNKSKGWPLSILSYDASGEKARPGHEGSWRKRALALEYPSWKIRPRPRTLGDNFYSVERSWGSFIQFRTFEQSLFAYIPAKVSRILRYVIYQ